MNPLLARRGGTEEESEAIRHRCRGGGFHFRSYNMGTV